MTENNWINEAFKKAQEDAERGASAAYKIRAFLDENTPTILDKWSRLVGREKSLKFAVMLSENDEFNELVETLTECFTVAGYLLAQIEKRK